MASVTKRRHWRYYPLTNAEGPGEEAISLTSSSLSMDRIINSEVKTEVTCFHLITIDVLVILAPDSL